MSSEERLAGLLAENAASAPAEVVQFISDNLGGSSTQVKEFCQRVLEEATAADRKRKQTDGEEEEETSGGGKKQRLEDGNPEFDFYHGDSVDESEFKFPFVILRRSIGTVIGKRGTTIQSIQSSCSVHINIDKNESNRVGKTTCTISGPLRNVVRAQAMISGLLLADDPSVFETGQRFLVPQDCVRKIVGKGGVIIKGVQRESGSSIVIDTEATLFDGFESQAVNIVGSPQARSHAVYLIGHKLLKDYGPLFDPASRPPPSARGPPPPPRSERYGGGAPPQSGGYRDYPSAYPPPTREAYPPREAPRMDSRDPYPPVYRESAPPSYAYPAADYPRDPYAGASSAYPPADYPRDPYAMPPRRY